MDGHSPNHPNSSTWTDPSTALTIRYFNDAFGSQRAQPDIVFWTNRLSAPAATFRTSHAIAQVRLAWRLCDVVELFELILDF
jgi:hypothetical protein